MSIANSAPNRRQAAPLTERQDGMDHLGDAQRRTEFDEQFLLRSLPARLVASLRRFPLVLGFADEMYSLLHRMALRRRLRFASYFLYMSPEEMAERHQPNTRTHAYMRDMRSFSERRPWATILDLELYREAWLAGAEWGAYTSRSCTEAQEKFQGHC